jgi:hypothetical protein
LGGRRGAAPGGGHQSNSSFDHCASVPKSPAATTSTNIADKA